MVRVAIWIFLLVLLPSVSHAQEAARLALLIGNQGYSTKVGRLKNPHNDVNLVDASLKQLGFKVTVLKDASYKAMDSALKRYVTEVRRSGNNALSFFYYSGHGVANPETQINYLIPIDIADADDDKVWFESFQQTAIIDLLSKQAPNATHYVVFDACRNELKITGSAAKALGADKGFVPIGGTAGLLIAYATAPRKTASDVGDNGGPYAKILAEEVMKPGVEAVTMFRNVQLRVKLAIGQDPWLTFPTLPAVYFAGETSKAPSQEQEIELAYWESVKEKKNPAVLATYLERYPTGIHASLARAMIEELKAEHAGQEEMRKATEAERIAAEHRAQVGDLAQKKHETKNSTEIEERQRKEALARAEALRKTLEETRLAREEARKAEEQRLAAINATEEAKARAKQAGLAADVDDNRSPLDLANDPPALTRALQRELKRVG